MKLLNGPELRSKLTMSDAEFKALIDAAILIEQLNLKYSNGELDSDAFEAKVAFPAEILASLLRQKLIPLFKVQYDPRGPAVRLYFDDKSYNTWGGEAEGYGILFKDEPS